MSEDGVIFVGMDLPEMAQPATDLVGAIDDELAFLSGEFSSYALQGHEFFVGFNEDGLETLTSGLNALFAAASSMTKRLKAQDKKHDFSALELAEDQMADLIEGNEFYRAKLQDVIDWLRPEATLEQIIEDGSHFRIAWSAQNRPSGRADTYLQLLKLRREQLVGSVEAAASQ